MVGGYGMWKFRLTTSKRVNCISHALFASAVASRLAAVVDSNARRLLIGDGDDKDLAKSQQSRPIAVHFEDLAKQLMKASPPHCLWICLWSKVGSTPSPSLRTLTPCAHPPSHLPSSSLSSSSPLPQIQAASSLTCKDSTYVSYSPLLICLWDVSSLLAFKLLAQWPRVLSCHGAKSYNSSKCCQSSIMIMWNSSQECFEADHQTTADVIQLKWTHNCWQVCLLLFLLIVFLLECYFMCSRHTVFSGAGFPWPVSRVYVTTTLGKAGTRRELRWWSSLSILCWQYLVWQVCRSCNCPEIVCSNCLICSYKFFPTWIWHSISRIDISSTMSNSNYVFPSVRIIALSGESVGINCDWHGRRMQKYEFNLFSSSFEGQDCTIWEHKGLWWKIGRYLPPDSLSWWFTPAAFVPVYCCRRLGGISTLILSVQSACSLLPLATWCCKTSPNSHLDCKSWYFMVRIQH